MSRISVIIPTFNRKHLIGLTLDNILSQSLKPFEIIVIDDHSTDDTVSFIKTNYKDSVKVYLNEGKGPGAARNTGFRHSIGDFIQFFDSDDLMTENKLETQFNLLIKEKCKKIVYGPYLPSKFENGQWYATDVIMQYYSLPHKPLNYLVAEGWCAITQSCLFTRDLIEEIGPWREDLMSHEDKEYWYRLGKHAPFPIHENKTCVIYRQHQQQITDQQIKTTLRTIDGIKALTFIKGYATADKIPFYSRIRLNGTIAAYRKSLIANNESDKLLCAEKLYLILERFCSKVGRLKTKTAWQPMHGISNDQQLVRNFFKLI